MTATSASHETGKIRSGDVNLHYRRFGRGGTTPILICHGGHYYDSFDWIEVASELSGDREVATWDTRGFGLSDWSQSKNYSYDALMADVINLLDHFGWLAAIILGHSLGGGNCILFASRFPQRTKALIVVDHCPADAAGLKALHAKQIGIHTPLFPSIESAQTSMSRDRYTPPGSSQRMRLEALLTPVDGGYVLPRDPDYLNRDGIGLANWRPEIVVQDMWQELARVKAPILILRGTRSDRYQPAALARLREEFPAIVTVDVDSGHDMAAGAPQDLIENVRSFLAEERK